MEDRMNTIQKLTLCNKKAILPLVLVLLFTLAATGCGDDGGGGGNVTVQGSQTVELPSATNQSQTLTITTDGSWQASCDAAWLTFAPQSGQAGTTTITLTTTTINQTKSLRSARLTISCGGTSKTVTVRQSADYALFLNSDITVGAEGGTLSDIAFVTNLSQQTLNLYVTQGIDEWIVSAKGSGTQTRAELEGRINTLRVLPNTDKTPRTGGIFLAMTNSKGDFMALDTLWIHQEGRNSNYTSTDYSADGKTVLLHEHTQGKGIKMVLMGDGFTDLDIASGHYDEVMGKAVDHLFSEQPISSLKDYFDVYQLTCVSPNDQFGGNYKTALGCVPDYQTTGIDIDEMLTIDRVRKVVGDDIDNTLAVVIVNTTTRNGVTMLFQEAGYRPAQFALALCALVGGEDSDTFRQVLTHEAIGHGFAKLGDEYVNSANGSATASDIASLREEHGYGWFLNIDAESDAAKTVWGGFVGLSGYENEQIGAYEGALTFFKGMYRPTQNSMMNQNESPFNAPSRRAIYNKVLKLATDKEPTFDEFIVFDAQHKPTVWDYSARQTRGDAQPTFSSCVRRRLMPAR